MKSGSPPGIEGVNFLQRSSSTPILPATALSQFHAYSRSILPVGDLRVRPSFGLPAALELSRKAVAAAHEVESSSSDEDEAVPPPSAQPMQTFSIETGQSRGPGASKPSLLHTKHSFTRVSLGKQGEETLAEMQQLISSLVSMQTADAQKCKHVEQLMDQVRELCTAAEALAVKERENENLTKILRELSETRAEAIKLKVLTLESYHKLQDEYAKVVKNTQLAHAVSRSNLGRVTKLKTELADVRAELHKAKQQISSLQSRNHSLREDNASLRRQVSGLETQHSHMIEDCRTRACMKQLFHTRSYGLY